LKNHFVKAKSNGDMILTICVWVRLKKIVSTTTIAEMQGLLAEVKLITERIAESIELTNSRVINQFYNPGTECKLTPIASLYLDFFRNSKHIL